jgi:hypothetical protein
MFSFLLFALPLLVNEVTRLHPTVEAAPRAAILIAPTPVALPCPVAGWRGPCGYMDAAQREQILAAVEAHNHGTLAHCAAARSALNLWLGEGEQAWVFAAHDEDDSATGRYLLGNTAHMNGRPVGFGLRAAVFTAADARTMARVALHEGAHLAGADEDGARKVDSTCT